jgi:hypothetical protein
MPFFFLCNGFKSLIWTIPPPAWHEIRRVGENLLAQQLCAVWSRTTTRARFLLVLENGKHRYLVMATKPLLDRVMLSLDGDCRTVCPQNMHSQRMPDLIIEILFISKSIKRKCARSFGFN